MKPFHSWSSVVTIVTLALCAGVAFAAPNVRVKRGDEPEAVVIADAESAVNPLTSQYHTLKAHGRIPQGEDHREGSPGIERHPTNCLIVYADHASVGVSKTSNHTRSVRVLEVFSRH
uniref:Uncharacterized protein n=1 Tax=Anopheles maculatus TaxID=74869 RepID=A0A182SK02_9DIPT